MPAKVPQSLALRLGANIVKRRMLHEMTQVELASKLGIAPDALSRIENGFIAPRFGRIEEIAALLKCSVAELFQEDNATIQANACIFAEIIQPLTATQQKEVIQIVTQFVKLLKS